MCKVFEDNSGALEIAVNHKYRPRTKHLNVKLHHFRDCVTRKEITIEKINTLNQLAHYLNKPVTIEILSPLQKVRNGMVTTGPFIKDHTSCKNRSFLITNKQPFK